MTAVYRVCVCLCMYVCYYPILSFLFFLISFCSILIAIWFLFYGLVSLSLSIALTLSLSFSRQPYCIACELVWISIEFGVVNASSHIHTKHRTCCARVCVCVQWLSIINRVLRCEVIQCMISLISVIVK